MENFISKFFTRKSAIRHLIQLGITVALIAWSYIAIALLTDDWTPFSLKANPEIENQGLINATGIMLMLAFGAVFGILTYWNAIKWMVPCLKKSGLYFLGAIPFVNLLVPEDKMNSWWEEISVLNSSDGTVTTYYDEYGKLYSDDGSMPLLLAIPLGILKALFKGVGLSLLNLIAAIGIPVLSPLSIVLGALATQLLMNLSPAAALVSAIVVLLVVLLVLIAQPVVVLLKGNVKEEAK